MYMESQGTSDRQNNLGEKNPKPGGLTLAGFKTCYSNQKRVVLA